MKTLYSVKRFKAGKLVKAYGVFEREVAEQIAKFAIEKHMACVVICFPVKR